MESNLARSEPCNALQSRLLTTEQAADILGVSYWTLVCWRRGGQARNGLAFHRRGNVVVYAERDVLAFKATRARVQLAPLTECVA
jgi:predicted site-specific integrase-resolvase